MCASEEERTIDAVVHGPLHVIHDVFRCTTQHNSCDSARRICLAHHRAARAADFFHEAGAREAQLIGGGRIQLDKRHRVGGAAKAAQLKLAIAT